MNTIKTWIENIIYKIGLTKMKRKSPILKEVMENPENVKLVAYIKGDEIVVRIQRRRKGP